MPASTTPVNILTLSGSLRRESSNTRLLALVESIAPATVQLTRFEGIASLPHFNPDDDLEDAVPHPAVAAWRDALAATDGIVISCPEYAHGMPGSFKNALDWLVSSASLMGKPVLLLNASPVGGEFAQAALVETLAMLGADVLHSHSRLTPFLPATTWKTGPEDAVLDALGQSLHGLEETSRAYRMTLE